MTVMFSDLVGSTALSARMDPEEKTTTVGRYRRAVDCFAHYDAAGYHRSCDGRRSKHPHFSFVAIVLSTGAPYLGYLKKTAGEWGRERLVAGLLPRRMIRMV